MTAKPEIDLENILTDRFRDEEMMEVSLSEKVFRFFFVLFLIAVLVIVSQLLNLGIFKRAFYKNRSLANMSYIEREPAPRGLILDRFGKSLLENKSALSVFLIPNELPKMAAERLTVLETIARVLGIDKSELEKKIREEDWSFREKLLLSDNLDPTVIAAIESSNLPGLRLEAGFKRVSAPPFVFSHLLGFTGLVEKGDLATKPQLFFDDEIGKAGLERYYDRYLRGVNGRKVFLKDAAGDIKEESRVSLPEAGNVLETFIDKEFQEYFYNRLNRALKELGREVGVGIAVNPQNGEVLALFGIPSFDTAQVSEFLDNQNQPFFNRAVSGLYTPGSTIKPLHALSALASKIIIPETRIFSEGFIEIPNPYNPGRPSRFLDWKAHGLVDLAGALARSSNVYFYEVGGGLPAQAGFPGRIGLGIEKMREWWQKFNLDNKTLIDLPGEEKGFLPSPAWKEKNLKEPWRLGDTYNVSIGQGDLQMTPIGLLNYVSAIGNGGKIYAAKVMKRIVTEEGEAVLKSEPLVLKDLSDEIRNYVGAVQKGMKDAVDKSYGTAHLLGDLPVRVAAKTGTSQVALNEKINAFFVGYAPANNPQIALLVLIENAREGSLNAVPVAKDALLWYYENRLK